MISIRLQIISLIGLMIYFGGIIYLLKKKTISLKYTLMWIFAGIIMGINIVFPKLLYLGSKLLGIEVASNAIFAIVLFFVLLILLSITGIVSKMNEKNKTLTQSMAILEKRVRELEKKRDKKEDDC